MRAFILILFLFPAFLPAQRYNDWWIIYPNSLTYNSGLHFSNYSSYPDTIGTVSLFANWNGGLGKTSISDFSGNLLFYTDGTHIFNRNHQVMSNGNFVSYNATVSVMGAVIVPYPCHPNQYFVFTAGAYGNNCGNFLFPEPDTLQYSIVDMSLDNGLGGVINTQKRIPLYIGVTDAINAVRNASGDGYWVVTHNYQGADFLAYELTCTGLNPIPVVSPSNILLTIDTTFYSNGSMTFDCGNRGVELKFNHQGNQLAMTHVLQTGNNWGPRIVSIAGFDNSTGVVSAPQHLGIGNAYFGIEYSPSGRYLYALEPVNLTGNIINIVQFDLSAGNITAINNSKTVISPPPPIPIPPITAAWGYADLQMGPDSRIYAFHFYDVIASTGGHRMLSCINYPDNTGTGCGLVDSIYDNNHGMFPHFATGIMANVLSDIQVCEGENTILHGYIMPEGAGYSWVGSNGYISNVSSG